MDGLRSSLSSPKGTNTSTDSISPRNTPHEESEVDYPTSSPSANIYLHSEKFSSLFQSSNATNKSCYNSQEKVQDPSEFQTHSDPQKNGDGGDRSKKCIDRKIDEKEEEKEQEEHRNSWERNGSCLFQYFSPDKSEERTALSCCTNIENMNINPVDFTSPTHATQQDRDREGDGVGDIDFALRAQLLVRNLY